MDGFKNFLLQASIFIIVAVFILILASRAFPEQWTSIMHKDVSGLVAEASTAYLPGYTIEEIRSLARQTFGERMPNQWRVFPIYTDPNEAIKFHLAYARTFEAKDYYPSLEPLNKRRIYGDFINYPRCRIWRKGGLETRKGSLYEDIQFKIVLNWGTTNPEGDLNMDGICDVNDYIILVQWWDWWEMYGGKEHWTPTLTRLFKDIHDIPEPTVTSTPPVLW